MVQKIDRRKVRVGPAPRRSEVCKGNGLPLRLGDHDRSIADYNAALDLDARNAWSLYGRGVDRLRKGMTEEGHYDIASALAIRSDIEVEARRYGIAP